MDDDLLLFIQQLDQPPLGVDKTVDAALLGIEVLNDLCLLIPSGDSNTKIKQIAWSESRPYTCAPS
jgi:hypothetical protein